MGGEKMEIMIILIIICSLCSQLYIMNTYNKYKKYKINKEITGFDVSRTIMDNHNLNNVYITEVTGVLTDHYYYPRKVIRLSKNSFHESNLFSIAMAAYESAHALMDKNGNKKYRYRKMIEPIINFITIIGVIMIISGLFLDLRRIIVFGVSLEFLYLIFQIITLPIEFEAARIAMDELLENSYISKKDNEKTKTILTAISFINVGSYYRTVKEALVTLYNFGNSK